MKSNFHQPLKVIGNGMLVILYVIGAWIAPMLHGLAHVHADSERSLPHCDTACEDRHDSDAETPDTHDDGCAPICTFCKLFTLGLSVPTFTAPTAPCRVADRAVCCEALRWDTRPAIPPSARGPPA